MTDSAHRRPAPLYGPRQTAMFPMGVGDRAATLSLNREGGDEYAV